MQGMCRNTKRPMRRAWLERENSSGANMRTHICKRQLPLTILVCNCSSKLPVFILLIYAMHHNTEAVAIDIATPLPSAIESLEYMSHTANTGTPANASVLMADNNKIHNFPSGVPIQDTAAKPDTKNPCRSLKRVHLSNKTITCNDGSTAGFYLRKNQHSKKWVVFLEGGWHCFDTRSCRTRWMRLRHLMTSAQWPETRDVGGILSPLSEENPYWHSANHVLIPYCSSDSWSGTRYLEPSERRENEWNFMGALILMQVIADLVPLGLGRVGGAELLLVGSSAGGLGVMLNLDHIANYLNNERNLVVTVRGVSDSGWFLDREPYTPSAIASSEAIRQGWKLWQGVLPKSCTDNNPEEPWRCYFGYRLYPTLKTPLFVFQWLFDEAQMRADNVGAPVTPQQWNYIHQMGGALRSSLDNVTAVFAPSCIGHAVISKREWIQIRIDDISLPAALRCWEHATRRHRPRNNKAKATKTIEAEKGPGHQKGHTRRRQPNKEKVKGQSKPTKQSVNPNNLAANTAATKEPNPRRKQKQKQRRRERQRQRKRRMKSKKASESGNGAASTSNHRQPPKEGKEKIKNSNETNVAGRRVPHGGNNSKVYAHRHRPANKQHPNEQQLSSVENKNKHRFPSNSLNYQQHKTRIPRVPEKCALRLLERCSWPQCNHSCPTLTNPLTGEEMRFLELLTSFGLDIEGVAAALGVDMQTLTNMESTELVNLLTQQVS